ncbi:MAG: carbohydrate kinase [Lentisphaerae bacterium]|nr:carbohydrate kinase [Lentisphaerota bacterium]
MTLLGYDIGTSSVKVTALETETGRALGSAVSPRDELRIDAPRPGWAEQDPEVWWTHACRGTRELIRKGVCDPGTVEAVGLSYQMHGLVALDARGRVLRPAILWCDSRAVETGRRAAEALGREQCLRRLLNLPGNFTASKLKWVKDNEPEVYARIRTVLLPGDYTAWRMTGRACTTRSGLSEGILWAFTDEAPAGFLLEQYGIDPGLLAEIVPTFGEQGRLTAEAADALGLRPGIPVTYRGGDQPNNALSLNVLEPGEAAVTAGTSGVVYGIVDRAVHDPRSRVNVFVHVNHQAACPRYGVLLCLNGAGILNRWLREQVGGGADYGSLNAAASETPAGADGLTVLPYGNGAERTLENAQPGASVHGLDLNRHTRGHLFRAAQEGVVFALRYGLDIMRAMGLSVSTVRAGHANLFLSPLFAEAFAAVSGAAVELYETDGSQGAARGAGLGAGLYAGAGEAMRGLRRVARIAAPDAAREAYGAAYHVWRRVLERETGAL